MIDIVFCQSTTVPCLGRNALCWSLYNNDVMSNKNDVIHMGMDFFNGSIIISWDLLIFLSSIISPRQVMDFLLEKHDVFCTRQSLWVFLAAGIVQRKDRSKFMRMI